MYAGIRVGGITDMSTVDWYGNVSLVVFLAGCNYRCPYCQNSGLIPHNSGKLIDINYIAKRIDANISILDSVVFSGGEPLLQVDALLEAAKIAKDRGLTVMLDTNGSEEAAVKKALESGLFNNVALDVKAPLIPEEYGIVTGRPELGYLSVKSVKSCLTLTKKLGLKMEARTTIAPGLSDSPAFIRKIAESIIGLTNVYYLQQFDNQGEVLSQTLKQKYPPTREKMIDLAHEAMSTGLRDIYIKTRSHGLEKVG